MSDSNNTANNNQHGEYTEWLRFSKMDYDCAKYLSDIPYHPKPFEIICYHCQQAAEKAVKALIIFTGSRGGMPKVHNVSFLLNQIKDILMSEYQIEIKEDLYDAADKLTPYGIVPRYPSEMDIDEFDMNESIQNAKKILDFANKIIELLKSDNT